MEGNKEENKLYVTLPLLIREIILDSTIPYPVPKDIALMVIKEIKKITNAECESALEYLKHFE